MKYRDVLDKREKTQKLVEELKSVRDSNDSHWELNKQIEREKFKYQIYNHLLKEISKSENKLQTR